MCEMVWTLASEHDTCVKHVSNMCQTCVKHVSNMCQTCVKHVSNMCQTCVNWHRFENKAMNRESVRSGSVPCRFVSRPVYGDGSVPFGSVRFSVLLFSKEACEALFAEVVKFIPSAGFVTLWKQWTGVTGLSICLEVWELQQNIGLYEHQEWAFVTLGKQYWASNLLRWELRVWAYFWGLGLRKHSGLHWSRKAGVRNSICQSQRAWNKQLHDLACPNPRKAVYASAGFRGPADS